MTDINGNVINYDYYTPIEILNLIVKMTLQSIQKQSRMLMGITVLSFSWNPEPIIWMLGNNNQAKLYSANSVYMNWILRELFRVPGQACGKYNLAMLLMMILRRMFILS